MTEISGVCVCLNIDHCLSDNINIFVWERTGDKNKVMRLKT